MASSAIKTPAFLAKAGNIQNEDGSSIYSNGDWSLKNSTAVASVTIKDDGNVGIGTDSPNANLQVNGYAHYNYVGGTDEKIAVLGPVTTGVGSSNQVIIGNGIYGTGGTETLRLAFLNTHGNQGITSGWNIVSQCNLDPAVQTSYFAIEQLYRGTTTPIRAERMRIDSSGSVNIGVSGSNASHTMYGSVVNFISTAGSQLNLYNANTRVKILFINTSDNRFYIRDADNTDGVYLAQNGTSWLSASDERLKKNIKPLELGLKEIKALQPKRFDFNTDESEEAARVGFIAQEVLPVLPHAVDVPEDPEGMLGVSPTEMVPVLVKAIQELSAKNEALEARLAALEAK